MSGLAPQWAFSSQAIDGAGDSHLSPGIHFRLLVSQLLGLPIRPFAVCRIALGQGAVNTPGGVRSDIVDRLARGDAGRAVHRQRRLAVPVGCPSRAGRVLLDRSPRVAGGRLNAEGGCGGEQDRGRSVATAARRVSTSVADERVVVTGNVPVNGVAWVNAINVAKRRPRSPAAVAADDRQAALRRCRDRRGRRVGRVARGAPTHAALRRRDGSECDVGVNPTAAEASRIATVTPRPAAWLTGW
jgi:hypothetical protein